MPSGHRSKGRCSRRHGRPSGSGSHRCPVVGKGPVALCSRSGIVASISRGRRVLGRLLITLAKGIAFSFKVVAASSYSGARALQCPHHGAKTAHIIRHGPLHWFTGPVDRGRRTLCEDQGMVFQETIQPHSQCQSRSTAALGHTHGSKVSLVRSWTSLATASAARPRRAKECLIAGEKVA